MNQGCMFLDRISKKVRRVGQHAVGSPRLVDLGLGNHGVPELVRAIGVLQDHVTTEIGIRRLLVLVAGKVDRPLLLGWLALG